MADDAGVFDQSLHIARAKLRDDLRVETLERLPEILALAKNRDPAQARLKSLEADLLEQPVIVDDRPSPFTIVIGDVQLVLTWPPASLHFLAEAFVARFFLALFDFFSLGLISASSDALMRRNSARTVGSTS